MAQATKINDFYKTNCRCLEDFFSCGNSLLCFCKASPLVSKSSGLSNNDVTYVPMPQRPPHLMRK